MKRIHHPLVRTLVELKGNPKIAVLTEPLFAVPFYLYTPFAALFMRGLGLSDEQIGLLSTLCILVQVATSLISGVAADKIGRRPCVFIFDLVSYVIPCVIWATARNFTFFLAAALLNGLQVFTSNAFNLILTEDAQPRQLVNIFNWVTISGLLAVFFAPIAGILVGKITLVPAVRILYWNAAICFSIKALLLFTLGKETGRGKARMAETRGVPVHRLLAGYKDVFRMVARSRSTHMALCIMLILYVTNLITNNFFAIYATEELGVPQQLVSFFPMVRSGLMLIFLFSVQPLLDKLTLRRPMRVGFALYIAAQLLLLLSPQRNALLIGGYILLDAMGYALVYPRKDSMMVLFVNQAERARIQSTMLTLSLAISAPFGWIGGALSSANRMLPFVLNMLLFAGGLLLVSLSPLFNRTPAQGVVEPSAPPATSGPAPSA